MESFLYFNLKLAILNAKSSPNKTLYIAFLLAYVQYQGDFGMKKQLDI